MSYQQRGLEQQQEQPSSMLIRDTRTLGKRIVDFLKNPLATASIILMCAVGCFFASGLADLLGIIGGLLFLYVYTQKATLPFRLPQRAGILDYNDPKAGSGKPNKARGIYFFGNQKKTLHEIWFANEDMRTHVLIFGSTGSGKTEALVSLAFNALLQGSGFIYVDGKGDNSLYAKVFSMVRYMGREDDMLLINFMTGAKDIIGPQEKRISNTLNPFSTGSSSMLTQLIVSMMDSSSGGGDGDMWKGRAIAFVEALMKVLVAMRDAGHILLDANVIRQYFSLDRVEAMVMDKRFYRENQDALSLEFLPSVVMEPINNYIFTLPGFNKERKGKQVSQVFEQHGFISMQLTRVFTSLADTYGHILRTKLAEVDLKDVVLNRRILVVLLPALEKSPDELSNLGKVIIASLRAMMAAGLGDSVEGDYRDLIQRKPTNAPTPYLCILDEYGYYAVKGFAVVPAQARSLGFSVVFAGQDLPAFQKASKEEAASIGANTNIKICMKMEDPDETWQFFLKTAGESYVAHVSGFQANAGSLANSYLDTRSASIEKRARLDLLDLKEQREGEATIFFKSKIVRMKMFFADPKPVKALRLNQMVKVDIPKDIELYKLAKGLEDFEKFSPGTDMAIQAPADDGGINILVELISQETAETAIERGIGILLAYQERSKPGKTIEDVEAEVSAKEGELTIFSGVVIPEYLQTILLGGSSDKYSQPLLSIAKTRGQLDYIERLIGSSESRAASVAAEIASDMQTATQYPPVITSKPTGEQLAEIAIDLVQEISLKKAESPETNDEK